MRRTTASYLTGAMVLIPAGCGGKGADSAGADAGITVVQTTTAPDETDVEKTKDTETAGAMAVTDPAEETVTLVATAVSLKYSYEDELTPMFETVNPDTKVGGVFDSSGKLQTQIEGGLEADVFISAIMKQTSALKEENVVDVDSTMELLGNKITLITSAGSDSDTRPFEDIIKDETIAISDPEGVSVGQYAEEVLTILGLWGQVETKANLGTNVTEMLNRVAEGNADAGVVCATDAVTSEHVKVVAEAPEGSLSKEVIYPVGVMTVFEKKDAAQKFVELPQSDEATIVFEKYGLTTS